MNFAGTFQVPCVFFCQNNQWAISVPRETQTASETIAQKAIAYGIPSLQVDGNDLFAVYKASRDAIERARGGGGPSMIEAVTYRLGDHTTADDARRYRDAKELEAWAARDPVIRTRKYLERKDFWNQEQQQRLDERAKAIVSEVVKAAEGIEKPCIEDIFDYTFATLPPELLKQKQTLRTSSLGQDPEQAGLSTVPQGHMAT
jgi:pyruvate dehydrogenase E1 component alpha subunit